MKHVIIGGGPAGLSGLEAIRRIDRESTVTVIWGEDIRPYSKVALSYWVGDQLRLGEEGLYLRREDYFEELRADVLPGRRVAAVHPDRSELTLEDGSRVGFDALLIAAGASPTLPAIEGVRSEGVFTLWTYEDARELRTRNQGAGDVIILGAGLVGMQALKALYGKGRRVTMVELADHILPTLLDAEGAGVLEDHLRQSGLRVLTGRRATVIQAGLDGRKRLILEGGEELPGDVVVVATGARPNIDLLEGSGIATDRGVLVDSQMRTNFEHIYAAGDIAEAEDMASGGRSVCGIWPVAVEQGEVAGCNMAGWEAHYGGNLSLNVVDVAGITVASMGILQEDGDLEAVRFKDPGRRVYRKILFGPGGRIAGAVLVGRTEDMGVIQSLIRKGVDLSSYKASIARRPLNVGRFFLPSEDMAVY